MSIDLCDHNIPIRACEICRDGVPLRTKKTEDVLVSKEWLTELIRDAHRYRFVQRGNSTHVLCGIWVPSHTESGLDGSGLDHWPNEEDVNEIVDAAMEMKGWK